MNGRLAWVLGAVVLVACGTNPGAPAVFEDAGAPPEDLGPPDLGVGPDAEPYEVGDVAIGVTDFGTPVLYPFTGVFNAFGVDGPLIAREIDGRLALLVEQAPYFYHGSIDASGQVELRSAPLSRSGCPASSITGAYDRVGATFDLLHTTCGQTGQPIQSRLRGGFSSDFTTDVSGIYEGQVISVTDPDGCSAGIDNTFMKWGLNVLPDGRAMLVSLVDVIDEPYAFLGRISSGSLALVATLQVGQTAQQMSFSGAASVPVAMMPASLVGQRNLWRPELGCAFSLQVSMTRTRLL